ncbi:hypothetical protein BDZ85DRAFT_125749 [Elsinoe ampelina]|uniref:Uncharacterized protein n=1 Tax=Elsinoe ampelina TaxID=302913 RepID=A0A6A6G9P3_9PEZI|nr:hypothetical protein BDZ85DRAFT_125749 [Elsinoe ampelina]
MDLKTRVEDLSTSVPWSCLKVIEPFSLSRRRGRRGSFSREASHAMEPRWSFTSSLSDDSSKHGPCTHYKIKDPLTYPTILNISRSTIFQTPASSVSLSAFYLTSCHVQRHLTCPGPLTAPKIPDAIQTSPDPICLFTAPANWTLPRPGDCCRNGTVQYLPDGCIFACTPNALSDIYARNCFRQLDGIVGQPVVGRNTEFQDRKEKDSGAPGLGIDGGLIGLVVLAMGLWFGKF